MNYILPELPKKHTTSSGKKIEKGNMLTIIIVRYELDDELEPTGNKYVEHLDVKVITHYGELSYNYIVNENPCYHVHLLTE